MSFWRKTVSLKYSIIILVGIVALALIVGGVAIKSSQNKSDDASVEQTGITDEDNTPPATESAKESESEEEKKKATGETSNGNQATTSDPTTNQPQSNKQVKDLEVVDPPPSSKTVTITITGSGFSPPSVTINAGDTVKWVNGDNRSHWPASDPHPQHTEYAGFDSFGISAGSDWSFKFNNTGTWNYHDHQSPSKTGVVVVQ